VTDDLRAKIDVARDPEVQGVESIKRNDRRFEGEEKAMIQSEARGVFRG